MFSLLMAFESNQCVTNLCWKIQCNQKTYSPLLCTLDEQQGSCAKQELRISWLTQAIQQETREPRQKQINRAL